GYYVFMTMSAIFYALAGMIFLLKALSVSFRKTISRLTVFLVFFGTNALYYTTREPGLSHIYSFFAASALIWFTTRFYEKTNWRSAIGAGIFLGLLTAIRPYNLVMALFPLLWGINGFTELRQRIDFLK